MQEVVAQLQTTMPAKAEKDNLERKTKFISTRKRMSTRERADTDGRTLLAIEVRASNAKG